jgi:hypothetical protein
VITAFGVVAAVTMVVAYALEGRGRQWVAVFAAGCFAAAVFGVITGAWVFAGLESVWGVVAVHRFRRTAERRDRPTVLP